MSKFANTAYKHLRGLVPSHLSHFICRLTLPYSWCSKHDVPLSVPRLQHVLSHLRVSPQTYSVLSPWNAVSPFPSRIQLLVPSRSHVPLLNSLLSHPTLFMSCVSLWFSSCTSYLSIPSKNLLFALSLILCLSLTGLKGSWGQSSFLSCSLLNTQCLTQCLAFNGYSTDTFWMKN